MSTEATDFVTAGTRSLKNFKPEPPEIPTVPAPDAPSLPGSFNGSPLDALIRESSQSHVPNFEEQTNNVPTTPPDTSVPQEFPTPMVPQIPQTVEEPRPVSPTAPIVQEASGAFHGNSDTMPCFTVLDMEQGAITPFTREYTSALDMTNCVAEIPMLLDYMVRLEREFGVTLPFKACGIDTIVFDNAAVQQEGGPSTVQITVDNGEGQKSDRFYEKITVDDVVYLSCINESLNPDFLHRIITEAVDSVYIHRQYVYTLVGPRPLNGRTVSVKDGDGADVNKQEFIETMKLNSYELSVFINYMNSIEGVKVIHGTYDGRMAIMFQR